MSRTRGGLEKQGRIGRVKERKERGEGREVNKVSCSLPVGALWLVVRVRRRPGTKGSWFPAAGSGPLAGKLTLSTPSGQDVSLGFFTNNDRFCTLDLKSEKWSVIRDKGVEVTCPMITEKNTGDKMNTQRAETMPALTQTRQTDNKYTSAENTALGLPGPP